LQTLRRPNRRRFWGFDGVGMAASSFGPNRSLEC
jgi:hypothetical protein